MTIRQKIDRASRPSSGRKWKHLTVFGAVLGAIGFLAIFIVSSPVYAGGGVGGGGDGSGGSGGGGGGVGNYTYYGYGWAQYNTGGSGPTDGFRDGTNWTTIQSTCSGAKASTVDVFTIDDQNGSGMGYNYLSTYDGFSGHFTTGTGVDHGKATALSNAQAQSDFNQLGGAGVDTSGFNFGQNVAWFCSNIQPPRTYTAPSGNVNAQRCQQQMNFSGINDGFDSNPQSYVVLTASGGNTPNRFPNSGYRGGGSYTYDVPNWVKNRTGSGDVEVQLWVKDSNGNDKQVGSGTISEPWGNCGNDGGGHPTDNDDCHGTTVSAGEGYLKYVTIRGTDNDQTRYEIDPGTSHTFGYTALDPIITIERDTYKNLGTARSPNWQHSGADAQDENPPQQIPCYDASCDSAQVVNLPGDPGVVQAGQTFDVQVTVRNSNDDTHTQTIPQSIDNYNFSLTEAPDDNQSGFAENDVGEGLTAGGSTTVTIYGIQAPNNIRTFHLKFYPDLYGHGSLNPNNGYSCDITVPIYQHFNIDPSASVSGATAENPTVVQYTTHGNLTTGPTINANSTSWLTKQLVGNPTAGTVDSHTANDNYGSVDHTYSWTNTTPINAGDLYCAYVTISPGHGFRGPSGYPDVGDGDNTSEGTGCQRTVNEPYVHFAGSGVSAGGGFGDNCVTNTTGGIYTYLNTGGARAAGSGSQFGAQALGVIQGLSSANLRSTAPTGLTGLTFSNSVNVSGSPPGAPATGGNFALGSNCVPDYFSKKSTTLTTPDVNTTPTSPIGTAGQQYYKPNGGTLTINGGSVGTGVNQTIYVDGNVHITNNITYSGARSVPADVQSLYIVVRGGNIYIDSGVTRLDGVYVAQPNGPSTGKITTCANGVGFFPANNLYDSCKQQLVVNGSFVAQQVFLDRTYSSLRYSQSGENLLSGSHGCGNLGGDVPSAGPGSSPDCAAEVFNFSPEMYLAQPAETPNTGPATGKYDYITSLSPVL